MKWTLQGNPNNQKGLGFTDQGLEKITSEVRTPICKKQCVSGSNYFMSSRLGSLARAALVPVWGYKVSMFGVLQVLSVELGV